MHIKTKIHVHAQHTLQMEKDHSDCLIIGLFLGSPGCANKAGSIINTIYCKRCHYTSIYERPLVFYQECQRGDYYRIIIGCSVCNKFYLPIFCDEGMLPGQWQKHQLTHMPLQVLCCTDGHDISMPYFTAGSFLVESSHICLCF